VAQKIAEKNKSCSCNANRFVVAKKKHVDEQQQSRKCISISQENGLGNKTRQML